MAAPVSKICTDCGRDCAKIERFKDPVGRYFCGPCQKKRIAAQQPAPALAGAGSAAADDAGTFALADLAAMEAAAPTSGPAVMRCCSNCGHAIGSAIICTSCGFNTQTNKSIAAATAAEPGKASKGRKCGKCGYSLAGIETPVCPECGFTNFPKSRREREKDQNRHVVRNAYLHPIISLAIGLGIAFAVYAANGVDGDILARAFLIKYAISVPIGIFGFFLCCLIWIGFDAPWHLTAIRLAAVYAIVDAAVALFSLIGIPVVFIPWVLQFVLYVSLLSHFLDLDIQDAVLVGLFTALIRIVTGVMIIMYLVNNGYM